MPFVNEEQLKKQNKLIKEYLNNRKLLKKRLQNASETKKQLQESASELFLPITKSIENTQEKIDERQDKLIQSIQNQLASEIPLKMIEAKPKSSFSVNFERDFSEEEKELLADNDFETDITTLVQQGPNYIENLVAKTRQMNQVLGGMRKKHGINEESIDKKIETFKKYREKLNKLSGAMEFTVGKGLKDPNKLCERLHLLAAAKQAGNNNKKLDGEIASILNKLKVSKCISDCEHKKLCGIIIK